MANMRPVLCALISFSLVSTPFQGALAAGVRIGTPVKPGAAAATGVAVPGAMPVPIGHLGFPVYNSLTQIGRVLPSVDFIEAQTHISPSAETSAAASAEISASAPQAPAIPVSLRLGNHTAGISPSGAPSPKDVGQASAPAEKKKPHTALFVLKNLSAARTSGAALFGKTFDNAPDRIGAPLAFAQDPKWSDVSARKAPAVKDLSYARSVSVHERALFQESLTRRKAGWFRNLSAAGVTLSGARAPTLKIIQAESVSRGSAVAFTVVWEQGERNLGSFRAVVDSKKLDVSVRKLPAPKAKPSAILTIQFLKGVEQAEIDAFLENHQLRLLRKDWTGSYDVAVTGKNKARAFASSVSGKGPIFYARAQSVRIPESRQLTLTLKNGADQAAAAKLFRANDLYVLEKDRDGRNFRVGTTPGVSAAKTASRLTSRGIVQLAKPLVSGAAEDQIVVVQFNRPTYGENARPGAQEADIARTMLRGKLEVVEDLGDGAFKVAAAEKTDGKKLAEKLRKFKHIASALHVGAAGDSDVKSAAASATAYKGRPWSQTEYNMHYHYARAALIMKGATDAQLKEFARLSAEAPIKGGSFNPWSGD